MTAATVLIPTHDHVETLRHAVASVQQQRLQDFEVFIVGDGVADATRAVVAELAAADRRIRFFDCPKGPRKGEIHRHQALQHAQGRFVAYLGDDDCWLPDHLDVLDALLADADFAHTMQVGIDADGKIVVLPADLQNPAFRDRMLTSLFNRFDLTFAGHTMAAYRRLPHGWRTTPPEFPWTDLYMWRQFLAEPWCRARSAMVPTGINTWTHRRPHLSDRERADDLALWRARAAAPEFRESLWRAVAQSFAGESVGFELEAVRCAAAHTATQAELARSQAAWTQVRAAYDRLEATHATAQAALAQAHAEMIHAQTAYAGLEPLHAATQADLARSQAALTQAHAKLAQTEAALAQSQASLRQLRAERELARLDVEHLEAERSALAAALAAMTNSTSWRVTRPLRRLRLMAARFGGPRSGGR